MELNHTTGDFSGLESLGNSEAVSSLSAFLSLEDIGLTQEAVQNNDIPLDIVNKTTDAPQGPQTITIPDLNVTAEPATGNTGVIPATTEPAATATTKADDLNLTDLSDLDKGVDTDTTDIPVPSNYKSILSDLIAEGVLPGIDAFTDEEGNEIPFAEMDIDKETLLSLIKDHQEEIKEESKKDSIEIKGISEFTQKLINIEKHGGNVQQALETYQQVKYPIDTINITEATGQKAICYLRFQAQGIDDSMSRDLISAYEAKGILEEKAIESKEQLENAFMASMAKQEELAIEQEQKYKAALKIYRGTLDNVFKDQELSDTHRRKLLDIATKQTESGDFELDILIENFRKNPIDAADLIMFVTDKDNFIKKKSESLVKKERIDTLRKVNVVRKGTASSINIPEKAEKTDPYLLDLSKLL